MEIFMALIIGLLFAVGTYMMLSRDLLRLVFGSTLLTHGAHLLLMTMGGLKTGAPPVLVGGEELVVDPLPQALILTSIVINFGVSAFLLVLAYRVYQEWHSTDLLHLRRGGSE